MEQSRAWSWDLVGLPWAEAEPILKSRGLTYDTVVTHPPNKPVGVGPLRVVAEQPRPAGLRVVLAHRAYERPTAARESVGPGSAAGEDPEDQGGN